MNSVVRNTFKWHHSVHHRFGERLHVYLLTFSNIYQHDSVRNLVQPFFQKSNICGYEVCEVFGSADLIVKVWLPNGMTFDFHDKLREGLNAGNFSIETTSEFSVNDVLYNYLWLEKQTNDNDEDYILSTPTPSTVLDLNANKIKLGADIAKWF